jgi:hypothetical protein
MIQGVHVKSADASKQGRNNVKGVWSATDLGKSQKFHSFWIPSIIPTILGIYTYLQCSNLTL